MCLPGSEEEEGKCDPAPLFHPSSSGVPREAQMSSSISKPTPYGGEQERSQCQEPRPRTAALICFPPVLALCRPDSPLWEPGWALPFRHPTDCFSPSVKFTSSVNLPPPCFNVLGEFQLLSES